MDIWFCPEVGDFNIQACMNLIQLDGYNPLVVEGVGYIPTNLNKVKELIQKITNDEEKVNSLLAFINKGFTPGRFLMEVERRVGKIPQSYEQLLAELLPYCEVSEIGALHEGYWIDHWFYNLDLIESYLAIYPDRIQELLIDNRTYTFFDNPDLVQPRSAKTILKDEKIRQYNAVVRDIEKEEMISSRLTDNNKVHTQNGQGEIYTTNLLVKLLCLLTNKISSLDPLGNGLEMEAGKPGWCDSLNGLPGLFGSSLCETLEMIRLCRLMLGCIDGFGLSPTETQPIFTELDEFIQEINQSIQNYLTSKNPENDFEFWQGTHAAKENYRERTKFGIVGTEELITFPDLAAFTKDCLEFLEIRFSSNNKKKLFLDDVPYTYFINEVSDYAMTSREGEDHCIKPERFQQRPNSLFLEGPTHYIRMYPEDAGIVYAGVRNSDLYDKELNTFKVSSSLATESYELGRIKSYPSGWIENESIYTHMQFKWLLELLRAGLYDQFFKEIQRALPPNLDLFRYARSPLENCSFIASSAHPDPSIHGQGFQPRFCGVTAEFINIWLLMTVGKNPFSVDKNHQLQFCLQPILPEWLFTQEESAHRHWNEITGWEQIIIPADCFAFTFLGNTLVVYHNPKRRPTYGSHPAQIQSSSVVFHNGEVLEIQGDLIGKPVAGALRERKVKNIKVSLG
jgi:hypothetical protein